MGIALKTALFLPLLALFLPLTGCESAPSKLRSQGLNLYDQGNYSGAADKFEAALRYDESEPKANYYAGAADFKLGHYSEAAYHYKLAWQHDPSNGDMKEGLAESLIKTDKKDEAMDFLERDAALTNKPADRIRVAEMYEKLGDLDNAELNYRKAAAMPPPNVDTQVKMGQFYERIGKKDLAAQAFKSAYKLDPTKPGLPEMLSRNGVGMADVVGR